VSEQQTALTTTNGQSVVPATQWDARQIDIIKRTIAPGISDDELYLFALVCQRTGLDPFFKQIYAIGRNVKVGNGWEKRMTIQTGIDGYRLLAARTDELAGIDDAVYDTEEADHPRWARVTVWRMVSNQRVPFTAKARWDEYVQTDKEGNSTGMWKKMPYLMLAKCAESLALRKAFPAELSGIYTNEEMQQADADRPVWATDKQIEAMHKECQMLVRDCPTDDELHAMTYTDLENILEQYRREYKYQQLQEGEVQG
jgi:phage recombination protein Bet